ncbi:MAG TPA: DegT/DnrJ/EryC1/StrS family aminotransferase [bacterium]|nr:DegT/DnrJ/EryC1/StrS family aminotransferase [bacterium]HPP08795.1 DegT/DnrJ/EryC1/StrS family aminotransferase [bacterium]
MQVPFHKPYIAEEEIEQVVDSLKSGWVTMGPKTIEFENQFKNYIFGNSSIPQEKQFAIAVNSCTAALHLALKAIDLKQGDEVILPTNTFVATAEVVTYFKAIPVLCDIEESTHNMDVSKIEDLITEKTRVILPVHFGGQPCDMNEIMEIARNHHLYVIEDAAHALPAKYRGKTIGTIGDITCFSFYATKTLCTGEGGMITTTNEEFAKRMKINRLHGINRDAWDRYTLKGDWYYEVVDNGHKYNTTDINSALGLAQLKKIEWMWQRRLEIAKKYNDVFLKSRIKPVIVKNDRESAWHLYVVKVNNRDELIKKLKEDGIGTSVHFIPVHKHPYYKNAFGYDEKNFPVANSVFEKCVSLPIYPGMKSDEQDFVIERVLKYAR